MAPMNVPGRKQAQPDGDTHLIDDAQLLQFRFQRLQAFAESQRTDRERTDKKADTEEAITGCNHGYGESSANTIAVQVPRV